MKSKSTEQITIVLPQALSLQLRSRARQNHLSLNRYIRKKLELQSANEPKLGKLPLKEIMARTAPADAAPDARLDFYS